MFPDLLQQLNWLKTVCRFRLLRLCNADFSIQSIIISKTIGRLCPLLLILVILTTLLSRGEERLDFSVDSNIAVNSETNNDANCVISDETSDETSNDANREIGCENEEALLLKTEQPTSASVQERSGTVPKISEVISNRNFFGTLYSGQFEISNIKQAESRHARHLQNVDVTAHAGFGIPFPVVNPILQTGSVLQTEGEVRQTKYDQNRDTGLQFVGFLPTEPIIIIDPSNPEWWSPFAKLAFLNKTGRHIPALWKGPLGSGDLLRHEEGLGVFAKLRPNGEKKAISWESFSVPLPQPNQPYLLEVEYLADSPQTFGINIWEPNHQGVLCLKTLESGIDVAQEVVREDRPAQISLFRAVFWPKTSNPMIVVTNRQDRRPAIFGKIRISRIIAKLPKSFPNPASRLFAAYLHRPDCLFMFSGDVENGQKELFVDRTVGNLVRNHWDRFCEGGDRLTEYLQMVGYGGAMISICSEGQALFDDLSFGLVAVESNRQEERNITDSGQSTFLTDSPFTNDPISNSPVSNSSLTNNPVPSDALTNSPVPNGSVLNRSLVNGSDGVEYLANLFDREGLAFIPAIGFDRPMEQVDLRIQLQSSLPVGTRGLRWVGPNGLYLADERPRTGPDYNLLHPDIQKVVFEQVDRILNQYGQHSSLGGIAIQLSSKGFAQLAEPCWGLDDETIGRFEQETNVKLPFFSGPDRFRERWNFLQGEHYETWIRWRAGIVTRFYQQLSQRLARKNPRFLLYLAGATMLDSPSISAEYYPTLTRKNSLTQTLLSLGFDMEQLGQDSSLVFLQPRQIIPASQLGDWSIQQEMLQAGEGAVFTQHSLRTGTLFYKPGKELLIPSFESSIPYEPIGTRFTLQTISGGVQHRKPYIEQLAIKDQPVFFEGGVRFSPHYDESLFSLLSVFRALPPESFQTFLPDNNSSIQPVTVRFLQTERGTYVYWINSAPFHVEVQTHFATNTIAQLQNLTCNRVFPQPLSSEKELIWRISLEPYDMVGVRLSDSQAIPTQVIVQRPESICGDRGKLNAQIDLLTKAAQHRFTCTDLVNPNFESPKGLISLKNTSLNEQQGSLDKHQVSLNEQRMSSKERHMSPKEADLSNEHQLQQQVGQFKDGMNPITKSPSSVIPGWTLYNSDSFLACLDSQHKMEGQNSLKLCSSGETGIVLSNCFQAPPTGRLLLSLWIGIPENTVNLPLRLSLLAKHKGEPFLKTAALNETFLTEIQRSSPVEGVHWRNIRVPFTQLPLEELSDLAIRFELQGAGTVWIDDVQMERLSFSEQERLELMRLISVVRFRQANDRFSDALNLLESFWPQLLLEEMSQVPPESKKWLTLIPAPQRSEPAPPLAGSVAKPVESKETATPISLTEPTTWFGRIRRWFFGSK
ncbi:MAG: hypothetical protein ACRC10_10155 [Thermoguttaceae bacterium]